MPRLIPRRSAFAFLVVLAAAACGERRDAAPQEQAAAPPSAAATSSAPPAAPASPSELTPFTGAPAPITGTIHEVQMVGDAAGYRFEPSNIVAQRGDGVRFVLISGGPHEIAFDLSAVPQESSNQLQANMPNGAEGRSPLLAVTNEAWTVSLGNLTPGRYPFVSTPRLPQGMKGSIEVR